MKIIALKYGESVFGANHIFKGGDKNNLLPISFVIYLIQTENKNILVDVGCDDGAGFEMSVFQKPVDVLRDYGLLPEDITDVIITHSHHDHIEANGYYKNATIHIQKDEYEMSKKYISNDFKLNLFDESYTISNDIEVIKIGGHSIGSSVVLASNYVFCGDECYYRKCLTDRILTGSSINVELSEYFIKTFSDKKYIPLLFHDPEIMPEKIGSMRIL